MVCIGGFCVARTHYAMSPAPLLSGTEVVDTDDRKRAEEALRASQRNLSLLINTMPTLAGTARPDGYCDFFNQPWLDYTGLSAEQAQGSGWAVALHPDDLNRLTERWQTCLASATPIEMELRMRHFDGAYRWCLIRGDPLHDESGKIVKWYVTTIDIDDRKRAEMALSDAPCRVPSGNRDGSVAPGRFERTPAQLCWSISTDGIGQPEYIVSVRANTGLTSAGSGWLLSERPKWLE
jgi:PAS domain S-box-containing protein